MSWFSLSLVEAEEMKIRRKEKPWGEFRVAKQEGHEGLLKYGTKDSVQCQNKAERFLWFQGFTCIFHKIKRWQPKKNYEKKISIQSKKMKAEMFLLPLGAATISRVSLSKDALFTPSFHYAQKKKKKLTIYLKWAAISRRILITAECEIRSRLRKVQRVMGSKWNEGIKCNLADWFWILPIGANWGWSCSVKGRVSQRSQQGSARGLHEETLSICSMEILICLFVVEF